MKSLLILFYRNPELGKVKTRLAKDVGDEKALSIYLDLCAHTRNITHLLACDKVVYYSQEVQHNDLWPDAVYSKKIQTGLDLGERMSHAFQDGFAVGYTSICIIGTDCLELTPAILQQAFTELEISDAVVGPARDGGYYLLGMKQFHAPFFIDKEWSTDTVYRDTLIDLESQFLSYSILPMLRDVDEATDLPTHYGTPL
ncbi:MAG: TIGR04282 family arsenosugar biosynthesis glycosyltransferase [Cyclobacteriaceae bacterium]|jgi:rSAM/selenodomain-associated transferase 1